MSNKQRALRAGLLTLTVSLGACANFTGITPQAKPRDAASLGLVGRDAGSAVDAQWWRAFGDAQLDRLETQALESNPNLKLAQARLARARAVIETTESASRPQFNGALDLTHQRYTKTGAVPAPLAGSIQDTGTLQLGASWELDFFGKNRAALDAALGSAQAAQADAQSARVLLASNVARSYFQWQRLQEQLTVAQRTLSQREETLRLVRQRVEAGLDTQLELRQSEGGLPEARQQIEALQEQAALTQHALAALVGAPNASLALEKHALTAIKNVAISPVIPADLLGRRADVVAARWRVEAGMKDVVNAKTQFYPNVNLVAFAGFSSIGTDRLLQSDSQQWGIGPALRLPLFDGGRLRANLRGKTADLDAAIESYNATVIDAVRDVADQVASMQSIARQQTEQRAAQQAAESAYAIAVQRYEAGLGNYLNVLSAETAVLAQRRQAVDLSARALDTQVALLRALGGGFQAEASSDGDSFRSAAVTAAHTVQK
ncbi:MAG: efflux transporter outer membrane subunit [Burkholderiales bacterium]|nr:efflux transporter outer membrane subunit [Burkholderiales bacterium]